MPQENTAQPLDRLAPGANASSFATFQLFIALFSIARPSGHPGGFCCQPGRRGGGAMSPEQWQSLEVLLLAMVPVALLWWAWLRLLN